MLEECVTRSELPVRVAKQGNRRAFGPRLLML